MAEILQVHTIQRRLFQPDVIPWPYLLTETNLEKIRSRYHFMQSVAPAIPTDPSVASSQQLLFPRGEFTADGTSLLLEQVTIDPVAVQAQLSADSHKSDEFFEDLKALFLEIDPNKNYSEAKELARTYQTVAVAKLSIAFDALFSDSLRKFLTESVAPRLKLENSEVRLSLQHLVWAVFYQTQTTNFSYLPRQLTIEPRQGSTPEDRLYFTVSPTDFETHVKLLEEFEKTLSG
jgi:hypothetical protein